MAKIDLPYIDFFVDRNGHRRHYFRRPGGKRIPIPAPGDKGFMAAYEAAKAGEPIKVDRATVAAPDPKDRSVTALIKSYYRSTDFLGLKPSTKAKYEGACGWLQPRYGKLPVPWMRRQDVIKIVSRKAKTGPAAANTLLKVLRVLIRHALDLGWRETDPTIKVRKMKEGTYHTWTNEEIAKFEQRWPVGSRERLAFALALYTGQRRADVAAMTWGDVDRQQGTIRAVQEKTGTKLTIPVHRDLREIMAREERRPGAIVSGLHGKRLTTESFGNFMAHAIGAAGLPKQCVLHGLRKAAARLLAEAGCSAKEIAAITGHKTLGEVQRYTEAADQETMARAGIDRLENKIPNPVVKRLGIV